MNREQLGTRRSESTLRRAATREGYMVRVRRSGIYTGQPMLYEAAGYYAVLAEDADWIDIEAALFEDVDGEATAEAG